MTNHTLQQFHTQAVRHKLSAAAILLWQYIYFIASTRGNYANLCLRTPDLTDTLHITRNGLQKVRRTLVNAGLLQVRIDHRQHVYYTLLIDGKPVGGNKTQRNNTGGGTPPLRGTANHHGTGNPSPITNTDIIHNNAYRKLVDAFCAKYTGHDRNTLESALLQFLYRRKTQGKTLTKAGLDALLGKLVNLAQNNIGNMIDIIQQSLNRGWTGFYPCRGRVSRPVANQYRPAYATSYTATYQYRSAPARMAKYDTKYEDLDYLEW